jgi:hypothetical protein
MYTIGQEVAVIRHGSWGHTDLQGIYKVTKSNKVRVHLERVSDGYERIFSANTGIEKGSTRYRSSEIVSLDRYRQIEKMQEMKNEIRDIWRDIQSFASNKDLDGLKNAIANLESI